jgi:hypothetical protein
MLSKSQVKYIQSLGQKKCRDEGRGFIAEGPQMVTKRGAEAAVLVPAEEWRRLQASARPSLKALLLSDQARTQALTPARRRARRRAPIAFR